MARVSMNSNCTSTLHIEEHHVPEESNYSATEESNCEEEYAYTHPERPAAKKEKLKHEYVKNKQEFDRKQFVMDIDQIVLENMLLKIEEEVYFGNDYGAEPEEDVLKRVENDFMRDFVCCNMEFPTFNVFVEHRETYHSVSEMLECAEENENGQKETESAEKDYKDRPYVCTVDGCENRYTSAYGLKYHLEKGHTNKEEPLKPHKCTFEGCDKRYKNSNGLKYHLAHGH